MTITEDVREYVAIQGIANEEPMKKGMSDKARQFVQNGSQLYCTQATPT